MSQFNSKEAAMIALTQGEIVPTYTSIKDVDLWLRHEISALSKTSKQKIGSYHRVHQHLSADQFDQLLVRISEWVGGFEGRFYYVENWKASWYCSRLSTITRQLYRCLSAFKAGVQSPAIRNNLHLSS